MTVFAKDVSVATAKNSDWTKIDRDTLPPGLKAMYDTWAKAQREANETKAAFVKAARDCMTPVAGKEIFFSAKYGDLSYAYLDAKSGKTVQRIDFGTLIRK